MQLKINFPKPLGFRAIAYVMDFFIKTTIPLYTINY